MPGLAGDGHLSDTKNTFFGATSFRFQVQPLIKGRKGLDGTIREQPLSLDAAHDDGLDDPFLKGKV